MTTSDEMGNFCHDYIQHPLMWCDEKKRLVERKNAEESLRMWRRRKAEEVARKEKDKQEYFDLFLKHCPWGRPGGGAPNMDVRRKDIAAVGLHSTPSVTTAHRVTSLQPCRYNDYFSTQKKCHNPLAAYSQQQHAHAHAHPHPHTHTHFHHHMAPPGHAHHKHTHSVHHLQESGPKGSTLTICERELPVKLGAAGGVNAGGKNGETLEITLKEHPSMSFRNKGHLDIEVRYKPTAPGKGKPLLEKIVVTETDKCPLVGATPGLSSEQKKKLQSKLEKPPSKCPWGKAGPGGKPWRSPKAVGNTFMKSLGWTNKEMLKELDQDNPVTPAEKPTFRKIRSNKKLQRCCDVCTCTCPAMSTGGSPPKQHAKKSPPRMPASMPAPPPHPHVSISPPKMDAPKPMLCARAAAARHCALAGRGGGGLTTATTVDLPTATTDNSAYAGGGVELVPLLARRRAINRPISLSSTDVTKRTPSHDRLSTAADLRYLHDLNVQITQKRRSISVSRQNDRDLCTEHFATFDTFWGRPGHGAPTESTHNKLKLDNLLYGSQGFTE